MKILKILILAFCFSTSLLAQTNEFCLGFEALEPNQEWTPANADIGTLLFTEAEVDAYFGAFTYVDGSTDAWQVQVQAPTFLPIASGNALWISNSTVSFDFSNVVDPVTQVGFTYWDGGGAKNISINGSDILVVNDFSELPPEINGVTITNETVPGNTSLGVIGLEGNIESLVIGGQELFIDNLCYTFEESMQADCEVLDLWLEPLGCNPDGTYNGNLSFQVQNPTQQNFDLWVNNEFHGFYALSDLPLELNNITPRENSDYDIVQVCINDNGECCSVFEFMPPDCSTNDCDFTVYELFPSNCSDIGVYDIRFLVIEPDFPSSGFDLYSNGTLLYENQPVGFDNYEPYPITNSTQNIDVFTICATGTDCCQDVEMEAPNCNCNVINEIILEETICDGDETYYQINLDYIPNGSESFTLSLGNVFPLEEQVFAYADLPITIGPVEQHLFNNSINVYIRDEVGDCSASAGFEYEACPPTDECVILNIVPMNPLCNGDGTFGQNIAVSQLNQGGQGYNITVNGVDRGMYFYTNTLSYIGQLPADGQTGFEIVVTDIEFPNCSNSIFVPPVDCNPSVDCDFTSLTAEAYNCEPDGTFSVDIAFSHVGLSPHGINVLINDQGFFIHNVNESFYTFDGITANSEGVVIIELYDEPDVDCNAELVIDMPDCNGNNNDCAFIVEINQQSCSAYTLFSPGEEPLDWYLNDEFQSTGLGYEFNATNSGTYEICVVNEGCPPETNFCETIVITEDCFEDDCAFIVEINQQSCSAYTLFSPGEEPLDWYLNDEFQSTGLGYEFNATNSGTYEICVVNEGCPPETNFCETIVITEDCFGDCAVGITINEIDCDTYEISESSQQQVSWFINDEFVSFFHGMDFDPTEAGIYEICAGIETPDCPQGVIACETIVITEDCFEDDCAFIVEINQQSCSAYTLFTPGQEPLDWYVNDEFQLTGLGYDFTATNAGTYEICVVNEGCPSETNFCETFVITEDCFGDCAVGITINEIDCDTYEISESSQQQVSWFINDEFVSFFHGMDFDPTEAGIYEICAGIETPDCPQGVIACETIVITEDCFEDDCAFIVEINQQSCSAYTLFTPGQEQLDWYLNDEFQSTGLGYDFTATNAGTYEICVVNEGCPSETNFCETFVITEDCFEDDCALSNLMIEHTACSENGVYSLTIVDVTTDNVVNDYFDVWINNEYFGFHLWSDLPMTFDNITPRENSDYDIVRVCANDIDDCCVTMEYLKNCNSGADCHLYDMVVTPQECDDENMFWVTVDLEYENTPSAFFNLIGNGEDYGTFAYADLPIEIGPFAGPTGIPYELIAFDVANDACQAEAIFGANCIGDNCIGFENYEVGTLFDQTNTDVGQVIFEWDNINVHYEEFTYFDGSTDNLHVEVQDPTINGIDGNALWISNSTIWMDFSNMVFPVNSVSMMYWDGGGEVNIGVNELDVLVLNGFSEAPLDIAPNVTLVNTILTNESGLEYGILTFVGDIQSIQIGGQEFFLDNVCVDIALPPSPADGEVWPGDANSDNIANHFDLLNIGLAHGQSGPEREVINLEWFAMPVEDWSETFEDGTNMKHADCNGDGVINEVDELAIFENYGLTHGEVTPFEEIQGTPNDPSLYLDFPDASQFVPGQAVEIPILLGSTDIPVDEIYGLAFTIQFTPNLFEGNIEFTSSESIIGGGEDIMSLGRTNAEGQLEIAITRKDQSNIGGDGVIGYTIGIIDDLAGLSEAEGDIINVKAIKANEDIVPLYTPASIVDLSTSVSQTQLENQLKVFPNPTSDRLVVNSTNTQKMEQIRILNLLGQEVHQLNPTSNLATLDVSDFATGIYFLEVQYKDGKVVEKFEVINE